ncbi:permease prefix domain 1-containing protein [Nocardioides caldifontis]|uniref:permease prefix domain 1-containing protein n=1 Tax=Nocardioides caldifontis TaxID=2588938 RepID=UPI0011DF255E|nr:permease prefix domain 1-containing protein [Nocardioides caldifontis]
MTEEYLRRLDATLVGPRRVRRELVREAGDHLEDATDAYVEAGYAPDEAAALAVRDFGTVEEVAPGFQETLAVAASRRTAVWLVLAVLIQPLAWDGGLDLAAGGPAPEGWLYRALDVGVEAGGGVAVLGTLLTLMATGVGSRWVRDRHRLARRVGILGAAVAGVVVAEGLLMTALYAPATASTWAFVVALLVVPFGVAAASARRTFAAATAAAFEPALSRAPSA